MRTAREPSDPLYLQVKAALEEQIRSGVYRLHQRVPSERELSEKFNVSRMTARQALITLGRQGLVYTLVGKGTFVADAAVRIDQQLQSLSGFSDDVLARGGRPSSRVIESRLAPAGADAARALRISPETEVVRLARVRLADGAPLACETAHLPSALVPGLLAHDFTRESLYHVLADDYRLRPARAEQRIEAGLAGPRELGLLELVPPASVLRMQRLTLTADGTPVEWVLSSYRGDRYAFRSILTAVDLGGQQ